MKILNSTAISPFGGLNFVLKEFENLGIGQFINNELPSLSNQSKYSWKDLFYSFWSLFFCGGDCAEDLDGNFKTALSSNPFMRVPSPDRFLNRIKELSEGKQLYETVRGCVLHEFGINQTLTRLNLSMLKKFRLINNSIATLDYDNTFIFANKADANKTYKMRKGYAPGVGLMGSTVVYVENRNGNSDAQTLQHKTLERMFDALEAAKIKVRKFRADSASYQLLTLRVASERAEYIYVRARKDQIVMKAISLIKEWEKVGPDAGTAYRGTIEFVPFKRRASEHKLEHLLKPYRLVVTKTANQDGQINLFTGEAYDYSAIITNDYEMTNDQIVNFYNKRGASEKEFDVLKNDFGWDKMPFSRLEYNAVYLIICAMCKNLYSYIINLFSKKISNLSPNYRIKKFIFRFVCIPAKWVRTGRKMKLRVYGKVFFET
ncbi:MAG: IS1380 family transposase [Bacteroidetes bacterium]|nr:IS1380 family transposase [Bacteroidota bacterium]